MLRGLEAYDQRGVDLAMIDLYGTVDKSRLGANAIVGTSLAGVRVVAIDAAAPSTATSGESTPTSCPCP